MNKYVLYNVIDLQSGSTTIYKRHFVGIDFVRRIADRKTRNQCLGIRGEMKIVDIIAVVISREDNPIRFSKVTNKFKILFEKGKIKRIETLYNDKIDIVQNTLGKECVGFPNVKNHFAKLDSAKERAKKTLEERQRKFECYLSENNIKLVRDGSFKNMYSTVNLICTCCGEGFSEKTIVLKKRKYPCKKCGERITKEKRRYEEKDYVSA